MIELWTGDQGVRLDDYGNVYDICKVEQATKKYEPPDLVAAYQSVLRELGYQIKVTQIKNKIDGSFQVYHEISGRYYNRVFGWETE